MPTAQEFFGLETLMGSVASIEQQYGGKLEPEDVETLKRKNPEDVDQYLKDLAAKQERREAPTSHRGVDSQSLDQTAFHDILAELGRSPSGWIPNLPDVNPASFLPQIGDVTSNWRLWGGSEGVAGEGSTDQGVFTGTSIDIEAYREYQRTHPDDPISPFEFALGQKWPDDPKEQDKLWANVSDEAKKVYESTGLKWPTEAPSVTAAKQAAAERTGGGGGGGGRTGSGTGGGGGAPGAGAGFDAFRDTLASLLLQNLLQKPPAFPGGVSVGTDPGFGVAIQSILRAMQAGGSQLANATQTASELSRYGGPGLTDGFDVAERNVRELAQTGGAPDITNALAAIRKKGLEDIDVFRAEERERFGGMGLSSGSDVAEAVGRGASQGVSDILARQESLIANILSQANQTRLAASGLAGQLSALPSQVAGSAAQVRATGAGMLSGIAELERNTGLQGASLQANIATQLQGISERNREREMQDFIRMTRPNLLQESLAFGVGFPPQPPVVQGGGGGGGWASLIPLIASIGLAPMTGGGSLFGSWFSSRELKDEPEELEAEEVVDSLRSLPMYRWNYKGDETKHLGPMAEDFQEAFGVGDGRTLSASDMLGVILTTQKYLAEKVVGSGMTEAARAQHS